MSWVLFVGITGLFILCYLIYLYRKDVRLGEMEREDEWMKSLPDEEWDVSDPWSDENSSRGAGR